MKTTKYKSVKNRKRALGSNQRAPFIPSKGGYRVAPIAPELSMMQMAASLAKNAMRSMRRPFRSQSR